MTLIAFDPRAPEIGRLIASGARRAASLALPVLHSLDRFAQIAGAKLLRRARRHRLEVSLVGGLGTTLLIAYLVFAIDPQVVREVERPAPAPAWVDVLKPLPTFSFDAPEFSRGPMAYGMRRHTTGGGREDSFTFGAFSAPAPYLRLVIHQIGGEGAPTQTLFTETARRAAEAGLALDGLGKNATLTTRFGPVEWAEARIAAPSQAAPREGCAIFRFASDEPALRVSGLVCGADGEAFPRRQLSCLIGRLDLAAAGQDSELQRFFARSELARDAACSGARPRAATSAPAPTPARQKPVQRVSVQR